MKLPYYPGCTLKANAKHFEDAAHKALEKLDFFLHIARAFGLSGEFTSKGQFLLAFRELLLEQHYRGKRLLLIVDECQLLSHDLLEEIRLFSNLEQNGVKLINIFFVGQLEFNDILLLPENKAIRQRITVTYNLPPLSLEETGQYIEHRLTVAGATKRIFAKNTIPEIFEFSKGYPRLINIICDRALLTGFIASSKQIDKKIIRSKVLTGGNADIKQSADAIEISMAKDSRHPFDTIITLELEGPVAEIKPISVSTSQSLGFNKKAQASNVYQNNWAYTADKALDDDMSTRWATDAGVTKAWLTIDLEKEETFSKIIIREAYNRIQDFELQIKDDERWKTFYHGKKIGEKGIFNFDPITSQYLRLNILKATDGPTLWEVQILP